MRLRGERREPRLGAGADAVGRDADRRERVAAERGGELVEAGEVRVRGGLHEPALERIGWEAVTRAGVAGAQEHDAEPHVTGGAHDPQGELGWLGIGAAGGIAVEIVELAHGGHARARELVERHPRDRLEVVGVEPVRGLVHRGAPAPEVLAARAAPLGAPADRPLERVPVSGDEPGEDRLAGEAHDLGPGDGLAHRRHHAVSHRERCAGAQLAAGEEEIGQVSARRHGQGVRGRGPPRI